MKHPVYVTERTLEDLGYSEVLTALAQRCRTPGGKERALARPFLDSREEVERALEKIRQARLLAEQQLSLPFGGLGELRPSLERAEKSGLLEPRELVALSRAMFAFVRIREALTERESLVPALAELARGLPNLEALARAVDRCFEADGEISDRASPELKEARDRTRGLHRAIKARLDQLLHDDKFLVNLRERYYTVRNGRYVVPVLSQQQAEVPGIVHNASQSGQTLFVEPEGMVGLGNQLAIAQSLVLEEERRVLQDLTDRVGREVGRIRAGLEATSELDELEAAAGLSNELGSEAPEVEPASGTMALRLLRHPLLVLRGKEVVANDVSLEGEVRALVISGPNAGGKTVTLTGVGLCALMLRAGLPIPAEKGSRLPLFGSVHSAVGDAQDLSQDLSTFSAHVLELRRILDGARSGALALIDEIAADTDPREGAAIAIAVLEALIERGARVLVTTHLEELKALTHVDPHFLNARVGFDPRKMLPTYKLQIGASGASSAIEVALRMGIPEQVCARARDLARNTGGPLSQALAAVEEERRKLAAEVDRAKDLARQAEAERQALLEERADAEAKLREEEQQRREAFARELERATGEAQGIVQRLRQESSLQAAEAMRRELLDRQKAERDRAAALQAEQARAEVPEGMPELEKGAWVHHHGLDRDVEVIEVDGATVTVAAGPMKMRVTREQIGPPTTRRPKARFPTPVKSSEAIARAAQAAPAPVSAANLRCDVRGMRVDEALREIESFLDRAMRAGDPAATILHGHGTGALKQSVRDFLAASPYVRVFRPGESHEGGDGVTLVMLRG